MAIETFNLEQKQFDGCDKTGVLHISRKHFPGAKTRCRDFKPMWAKTTTFYCYKITSLKTKVPKKTIDTPNRINAYNKVEEKEILFRTHFSKVETRFRSKITSGLAIGKFIAGREVFTSEDADAKKKIIEVIWCVMEILESFTFVYDYLWGLNSSFSNSHVSIYRAEDYYLNYEENLKICFYIYRLAIRDVDNFNSALFELDILDILEQISNEIKKSENENNVTNKFSSFLPFEKDLTAFCSKVKSHSIKIPGSLEYPFEYNPDDLFFDLHNKNSYQSKYYKK